MALDEVGAKPCPEDTCMHLQCLTFYNTKALKFLSLPSEEALDLKRAITGWDDQKLVSEIRQNAHLRNSQEHEVLLLESLARVLVLLSTKKKAK